MGKEHGMTAWQSIVSPAYGAILLLAAGCAKQEQFLQQRAKPDAAPREASKCVVSEGGLVVSINGVKVNFPDSEHLNWIAVKDSSQVDPRLVALGHAHVDPAIAVKHVLRVHRYATVDEYVLLCGQFDPPFPDGSFSWVVSKTDMRYVGHFLDKDAR
jgi:hypothetical protein